MPTDLERAPARSSATTPRPGARSATGSRSSRAAPGSSTSCSTSTRRASSSASRRSSSGSRATCGPRPSRPRSGSPSSTRSCRRAGCDGPGRIAGAPDRGRPRPAAPARTSGASATRGSRSRTAFRLVRGFVQRLESGAVGPVQARLGEDLAASARAPRPRSSGSAEPVAACGDRAEDDRRRRGAGGADAAGPARPRPAAGAPEPGAARGRLPRDRLGARREAAVAAAARRPRRAVAPAAVELAGGRDRPLARGGRARHGPRRPGRPARRRRAGGARRGGRSAASAPATGCSARGSADADEDGGRHRRAAAARRPPAARAADPGQRRASTRCPGGAGDPDIVPGRGLFAPPERFDRRPFSAAEQRGR